MTRFGWAIVLGIIGVLVLVGAFLVWRHAHHSTPQSSAPQATTTPPVNPASLSIYTSGQYSFALFYPTNAKVTDAYSTTTLAGIPWRTGATGPGTPIVRIQQGNEEVRVGVSTDTDELKACTQAGPAETSDGAFTVGSTTWQKFSFQKIGTDDEALVTSYRTQHRQACFALELFQPLSGTASSTTPANRYTLGDTITSFSFAN